MPVLLLWPGAGGPGETALGPAPGAAASLPASEHRRAARAYGRLPLAFEVNRGQSDPRVGFLARGGGYTLFLTRSGATLAPGRRPAGRGSVADAPAATRPALGIGFAGAEADRPRPRGAGRLPGAVNYLLGDDRARWKTGIPAFREVGYERVWPGIDLTFHGNRGRIEYDFDLAPGADPGRIALDLGGARGLRLDRRGDLLIDLSGAQLRQLRPRAYQRLPGGRRAVASGYRLLPGGRVGVRLGRYDRRRALTIDPVLAYSTFLGGNSADVAHAIAVDGSGSVFLAGETSSANFPAASPLQGAKRGDYDAFVAKLNPAGSALAYSTFLGGGRNEFGNAVAVDGGGNAYVGGETESTDFPTRDPLQAANRGGFDAFAAKLNPAGGALIYSTYLGGGGLDTALGVAVDASGSAHVTGRTDSGNFPAVSPLQAASGGLSDAFVAKLNPAGSALAYSTYLGGALNDFGHEIAVSGSGGAYVTGQTGSANFPTASAHQPLYGGGLSDAFVAKLNPAGSALAYATFLGGTLDDAGHGIAIDGGGSAYVGGQTSSIDFPLAAPFQATNRGGIDAFAAKLNPTGGVLTYSTYLGGAGEDIGRGIAVDASGSAHLAGETASTNFPTSSPLQSANRGLVAAFVSRLNPAGNGLAYSTYLGGIGDDAGRGIAVDASGGAYVAGQTESPNFPTSSALQGAKGGGTDAFVAKIALPPPETAPAAPKRRRRPILKLSLLVDPAAASAKGVRFENVEVVRQRRGRRFLGPSPSGATIALLCRLGCRNWTARFRGNRAKVRPLIGGYLPYGTDLSIQVTKKKAAVRGLSWTVTISRRRGVRVGERRVIG